MLARRASGFCLTLTALILIAITFTDEISIPSWSVDTNWKNVLQLRNHGTSSSSSDIDRAFERIRHLEKFFQGQILDLKKRRDEKALELSRVTRQHPWSGGFRTFQKAIAEVILGKDMLRLVMGPDE